MEIEMVFINGSGNERNKDLQWKDMQSLAIAFKDNNGLDDFVNKFPKFCKVKIRSIAFDSYTPKSRSLPYIIFDISTRINRTTGEVNEAGEKRRNKIYEILKGEGILR